MSDTELTGMGRPLPIKLSQIERFEDQPRENFNEDSIIDLANSIQHEGQKTPVRVCKHASKPGVFVLIGGERRWRAFQIIHDRTGKEPLVNAFVDTVNDHLHHFREALVDNLHREDIPPLDEAKAFHKLHNDHNMTVAAIANLVGKSVTHVDGRMKIHSLPESVKRLLLPDAGDRQINVTIATEISRSTKDPALQWELAAEISERQMGIIHARQLVHSKTDSPMNVRADRPGRKRKASDDFLVWRSLIDRTLADFKFRINSFDIHGIYNSRVSEETDRAYDAQNITELIKLLQDALPKVQETYRQRAKRGG